MELREGLPRSMYLMKVYNMEVNNIEDGCSSYTRIKYHILNNC
jgi:hypothetical protein